MLKIKTFPRIHISLIGMNNDGYRMNGGLGFSISYPQLVICFEPTNSISIIDKREQGFTSEERGRLINHLEMVVMKEQFDTRVNCCISEGMVRSHVGLGSNTIIYLSCVEALYILNKRYYTEDSIITMSGRGGTSGIGINTYFKGGFVFDVGIVNHGQRYLGPSSAFISEQNVNPLLFKELRLPLWDVGICIPPIAPKTENEEIAFFRKYCPVKKYSVGPILYEAVYGVTSALMEEDFCSFCKSIDAIQSTKWKSLERGLYGKELKEAEAMIRNCGAISVGMSSLGPLLYFFGDNIDSIVESVKREVPKCTCFKAHFNNSGRIIEDD